MYVSAGSRQLNTNEERTCLLPSSFENSYARGLDFSWSLLHMKGPLTPYEPSFARPQHGYTDESIQMGRGGQHQKYLINDSTSVVS